MTDDATRLIVLQEVIDERLRQIAKHDVRMGGNGSDDVRMSILTEEVGEVAMIVNDERLRGGDNLHLYEELVQVAAVAVAWAELIYSERMV